MSSCSLASPVGMDSLCARATLLRRQQLGEKQFVQAVTVLACISGHTSARSRARAGTLRPRVGRGSAAAPVQSISLEQAADLRTNSVYREVWHDRRQRHAARGLQLHAHTPHGAVHADQKAPAPCAAHLVQRVVRHHRVDVAFHLSKGLRSARQQPSRRCPPTPGLPHASGWGRAKCVAAHSRARGGRRRGVSPRLPPRGRGRTTWARGGARTTRFLKRNWWARDIICCRIARSVSLKAAFLGRILQRPICVHFGTDFRPPFPPAVAHRLRLSDLTAVIE